jgi:hypothetical protein
MPSNMRDIIKKLTDDAIRGVINVTKDHNKTATLFLCNLKNNKFNFLDLKWTVVISFSFENKIVLRS